MVEHSRSPSTSDPYDHLWRLSRRRLLETYARSPSAPEGEVARAILQFKNTNRELLSAIATFILSLVVAASTLGSLMVSLR